MEYADRIEIVTPEGVDLELGLAGLGARYAAGLVDVAIKLVTILALAVLLFEVGGGVSAALFSIASFAIWFFYDVLFEVLAGGRTPGKRLNGLRVIRASGAPIGFLASMIRNLVRIVDGPGTAYLAGAVSIIVSRRNQRLGDLAAATIVVRDSPAPLSRRERRARAGAAPPPPGDLQWDTSQVTPEELALIRQFLERRHGLDLAARNRLARMIATGLWPRVAGAPESIPPEPFLEGLAAVKSARG